MVTQNSAVVPAQLQDQYDDSVPPLWESVAKLGAAVPAEEWDRVPADLAANLDRYVYGSADES
jgi:hypothetical protein